MTKNENQPNPFDLFYTWYDVAKESNDQNLDAMAMATATKNGLPSVRVVLYKGIQQGGFLIYTNYQSRKAHDLKENPHAALMFYWPKCYRQIRIEGNIEIISVKASEQYFQSRPFESQVSAWASKQSHIIENREILIKNYQKYLDKFSKEKISCPPDWGGYSLMPTTMEFWLGKQHRLHNRICYHKKNSHWEITTLSP